MGNCPDYSERILHDLDHDCKSSGEMITREQEAARTIVELRGLIEKLEANAEGHEIQRKDILNRVKLAEAKLALVQKR